MCVCLCLYSMCVYTCMYQHLFLCTFASDKDFSIDSLKHSKGLECVLAWTPYHKKLVSCSRGCEFSANNKQLLMSCRLMPCTFHLDEKSFSSTPTILPRQAQQDEHSTAKLVPEFSPCNSSCKVKAPWAIIWIAHIGPIH